MCPACIETVALMITGVTSTGGLTALGGSKTRHEAEHVTQPEDRLFRREEGRMLSTLMRVIGVPNLI